MRLDCPPKPIGTGGCGAMVGATALLAVWPPDSTTDPLA